ncbi:MAG: transketolase C-terminal domain-containing protein [Candidatus Pacebacteria bacterium]|nr:transketolase C-terminal domain-containing protein [Candidatus Paceibacterota bacterium]
MKNLNPKLFDKDVEKVYTRLGYGEGLLEAGMKDKNVVALCADLTHSTFTNLFADKFPERFVQVGVAEQNMASVASGMARMGKIPFISSYAMFSPGRNWEQIRTTICYNNTNVKIVGAHAGVSVGPDGGTHQAIEDIALTRVIPRMTVIYPCDYFEAKKAVLEMAKIDGPAYIRLARNNTPVITTEKTPFKIGKAQTFFESKKKSQVGIIASGHLVYEALVSAKKLEYQGIGVKVINLSTIKPLDEKAIIDLAKNVKGIVTVEEHQKAGGMGSAVAELLSQKYPTKIEFIAINDEFGQSGEPEELIKLYKLDSGSIIKAVKKLLI